jgi:hypothetical protein
VGDLNGMRGNPELSKSIFNKIKKISESKGEDDNSYKPSKPRVDNSGGAFNSIMKRRVVDKSESVYEDSSKKTVSIKKETELSEYFDSIYESIDLLEETKDYSGVVRGLFTYYLAGKLDSKVLEGISREDRREIIGIVRDFEDTLRNN